MKKPNLFVLLSAFSKDEMKRFGKFVVSPYFQTERNLIPLYSYLKKYHPVFDSKNLSEEKIFSALYPGKKFEPKKSSLIIRVLFSEMTKLAKKFLAYEKFETGKSDFVFNNVISEVFASKKLYQDSLKILLENSDLLDKQDKHFAYYCDRIKIDRQIIIALVNMDKSDKTAVHEKNSLLHVYAIFFQGLQTFIHNGFTRKYNFNIPFTGFELAKSFINGFDPEIYNRECSDDGFETKNKTLFNYYILKSRLDENDKESLVKALDIYYKLFDKVSNTTKYFYFLSLYNRFVGRLNLDRFYLIKVNELIDFAWSRGIYRQTSGNYLLPSIYIFALWLKASYSDSAEIMKFVNTYIEKVAPDEVNDLRNFSMTFIYFKKKDFVKCLEYLSKNDSLDHLIQIEKYKLKICSLYEIKYFEEALYAADAFKSYLRSNENIGPFLIKDNLNFIKSIKTLLRLKFDTAMTEHFNTDEIVVPNKNTLFGDWLIEKVNELKN